MNKNDTIYKILTAVQLALLPMVFFAKLLLPTWSIGLMIGGIALAKIWCEILTDRVNFTHRIINSVTSIIVFTTLLILFIVNGTINVALGVVAIVLIALMNVSMIFLFNHELTETIDAEDFCFMLFECLLLISLTFVMFYDMICLICLIAILLTSAVTIGYKLYYLIKNRSLRRK